MMSGDFAFAFAVAGGAFLLGMAIMYGIIQWRLRSRSPMVQAEQDRATHAAYGRIDGLKR